MSEQRIQQLEADVEQLRYSVITLISFLFRELGVQNVTELLDRMPKERKPTTGIAFGANNE